MRHTLGLMVLLDLGRLVPALRLALMFAYRPGFELLISRLYHTHHLITNSVLGRCEGVRASPAQPCQPLFVHLGERYGKNVVVVGEDGLKESFPLLSFAKYIYIYIGV
jgi:hypothetical protein